MKTDIPGFDDGILLNALMESVADSIYFKDRQCRILRASQKMVQDLGYADEAAILGKTDKELFGEDFGQKTMIDDLAIMESGNPIIGLVESRTLEDGTVNWTSTTKLPIYNSGGELIGLLGITREINELKQVEQDLQYLATHDILTSLPNRFLLQDVMSRTIHRVKRSKGQFAVLYVDLDGFKQVNDRYGHDAGDKVLKQIATRMTSSVRETDMVARMGGDEFAIILEEIKKTEDAMAVAQKLVEQIAKGFEFLPDRGGVTASIGVCVYPEHGKSLPTLLRAADHAMYQAKSSGNACALFEFPSGPTEPSS